MFNLLPDSPKRYRARIKLPRKLKKKLKKTWLGYRSKDCCIVGYGWDFERDEDGYWPYVRVELDFHPRLLAFPRSLRHRVTRQLREAAAWQARHPRPVSRFGFIPGFYP